MIESCSIDMYTASLYFLLFRICECIVQPWLFISAQFFICRLYWQHIENVDMHDNFWSSGFLACVFFIGTKWNSFLVLFLAYARCRFFVRYMKSNSAYALLKNWHYVTEYFTLKQLSPKTLFCYLFFFLKCSKTVFGEIIVSETDTFVDMFLYPFLYWIEVKWKPLSI